jgi:hypothetical protein
MFSGGGAFCIHLQGIFYPKYGGSKFLPNASNYLPDHTALYPRGQYSSHSQSSEREISHKNEGKKLRRERESQINY